MVPLFPYFFLFDLLLSPVDVVLPQLVRILSACGEVLARDVPRIHDTLGAWRRLRPIVILDAAHTLRVLEILEVLGSVPERVVAIDAERDQGAVIQRSLRRT